jgi:hypothetical protein
LVELPSSLQEEHALLCYSCKQCLDKPAPYKHSLAAGIDFGQLSRLGLGPLTDLERALLADVRLYGVVLKINATPSGAAQQALSGHFISFYNDGLQAVGKHFDADHLSRLSENFIVMFTGPKNSTDVLRRSALQANCIQVNTRRIYNFLCIRQALDPEEGNEILSVEELDRCLNGFTAELVRNAEVFQDNRSVNIETVLAEEIQAHTDLHGETEDLNNTGEVRL